MDSDDDDQSSDRGLLLLLWNLPIHELSMSHRQSHNFCLQNHFPPILFAILVLFYLSVLFASGFCFAFIGSVLIPFVWSTISLCNYHEYFVASSVTTPYFCCIFFKMHTWSTGILKIAQMGDIQRDTFLRHS